jgi:beta-xylosidase
MFKVSTALDRRRRALLAGVLALALAATLGPLGAADARSERPSPVGSDPFVSGYGYRGDFPDPSVLRVGNYWFAYSTTVGGLNLPVLRSTDLVHWAARGEGLTKPAPWAVKHKKKRGYAHATTWAPNVTRIGRLYVHYYATHLRGTKHKMCISTSRSKFPGRGFVDKRPRPLICPPNRGAIDPSFFQAPGGGQRFLVWKSEQTKWTKAQIWITPLSVDGMHLVGPSRFLLQVQDPWEWKVIENPSMIGYQGRWYLFYSGGSYANNSYATGYAICKSYVGPCTRASTTPLLATGDRVSGPGGAMAFYDSAKQLRLAYAAWDYGHFGYPHSSKCRTQPGGCPQRRLHIATLGPSTDPEAVPGSLVVTNRG